MVQKSLTSLAAGVFLRIILFLVVIGFGVFFFPNTIHGFVINTLGYQNGPVGLFDMANLGDWEVSFLLSSVFWFGIIFGTLGKKIDYILFLVFFIFALWDYFYPPAASYEVFLGLIGAAVLGNIIGFILKLARKKLFPTSWIGR
jgi:hypothetical protein